VGTRCGNAAWTRIAIYISYTGIWWIRTSTESLWRHGETMPFAAAAKKAPASEGNRILYMRYAYGKSRRLQLVSTTSSRHLRVRACNRVSTSEIPIHARVDKCRSATNLRSARAKIPVAKLPSIRDYLRAGPDFLCSSFLLFGFCSFEISLVRPISSWGRPGRRVKGSLQSAATSDRKRTVLVHIIAMVCLGRVRTVVKPKKKTAVN